MSAPPETVGAGVDEAEDSTEAETVVPDVYVISIYGSLPVPLASL
jgi:hypothetical protein